MSETAERLSALETEMELHAERLDRTEKILGELSVVAERQSVQVGVLMKTMYALAAVGMTGAGAALSRVLFK